MPYLLGCGGFAALGLLMHARDQEQRARVEQLSREVAQISNALARAPVYADALLHAAPGTARLDSAAVDAIASRVAAQLRKSESAEVASPPEPPVPEPPTHAQEEALSGARRTFDLALARGRLSPDDVLELRRQLVAANLPEQTREIARRIAVAINTDKLIPDDPAQIYP